MLDWSRGDEGFSFVAERVEGGHRGFNASQAAAVIASDGRLVAGVVFHDWNPEAETIELSTAARDRRWMTRGVVRGVFGYVFGFCQAAIVRTKEDNKPVRKFMRAFGADEHVLPNAAGRGRALVIYVLTDAAWRQSKWSGCNG